MTFLKYIVSHDPGKIHIFCHFSRLNCCTDFNKIWKRDTLILELGHRLLFTAIADTHVGKVAGKRQ